VGNIEICRKKRAGLCTHPANYRTIRIMMTMITISSTMMLPITAHLDNLSYRAGYSWRIMKISIFASVLFAVMPSLCIS